MAKYRIEARIVVLMSTEVTATSVKAAEDYFKDLSDGRLLELIAHKTESIDEVEVTGCIRIA